LALVDEHVQLATITWTKAKSKFYSILQWQYHCKS